MTSTLLTRSTHALALQTILFDLDGTLVNSLPGIEWSLRQALTQVVPDRADELTDLASRIGPPIRQILAEALPDLSLPTLDKLVSQFRFYYDTQGWQKTRPYPAVGATLAHLRGLGLTCFIVTNKPSLATSKIVDHLGLRTYFQEIVSPDAPAGSFSSKTAATSYLVGKYRLNRSRTLFVGDSADDAGAAQSLGLAFAAAAYGYGGASENRTERTYTLSRFPQLLRIVEKCRVE